MIQSLSVHNYALIQQLEIKFSRGLTTITGETGAGKSILIGALSLVLGNRADTSVLKDKNKKCFVEAEFSSQSPLLKNIFLQNEIDFDENIILRREISPNGKSRSFINDTPVSLQLLKEVGYHLVDIHSQHENLSLNNNQYQLEVIDAFARIVSHVEKYKEEFQNLSVIEKTLTELKDNSLKVAGELDFLKYQFNELEIAALKEDEQDELESELEILTHAEEIKTGLYKVIQAISGGEINSIGLLKDAEITLRKIEKFHNPSINLRQRLESVFIELKDIVMEIQNLNEKVEENPLRIEFVRDRLNLLYTLLKKYHLTHVFELIEFRNKLDAKINDLNTFEFRMEDLEKKKIEQSRKVKELAKDLSLRREKVIPVIQEIIVSMLVQMGIPHARFEIRNFKTQEPGFAGFDNVKFFFTANRKTELMDIARVASGGELSRLMLSIKSLISGVRDLPTIIFDEIDSGVSGEIAFKVGKILKEMSADRQIFTITHLPQVAARGNQHFLVFKNEKESGTTTEIRLLSKDERVIEIAKLLSGEQTTDAAMANARELLG